MLTIETLAEIGLSNPTTVLAKIEATLEVYSELVQNGGKLE
jgi:hypothetical protein